MNGVATNIRAIHRPVLVEAGYTNLRHARRIISYALVTSIQGFISLLGENCSVDSILRDGEFSGFVLVIDAPHVPLESPLRLV